MLSKPGMNQVSTCRYVTAVALFTVAVFTANRDNWQKPYCRKLRLFGHICRMDDSRKIKTPVFGMMDGSNKRGRPHREWSDDIEQWCGATLQELSHAALDRQRWAKIVRMASDTNGH